MTTPCQRLLACVALLFILGVRQSVVAVPSPQPQRIEQTWTSPSGKLEAHVAYGSTEQPRQLRLRARDDKARGVILCEFTRSVDVLFSQDDCLIAVNDSAASDEMVVRLFRRSQGLTFTEVAPSPDAVSWRFFSAQEHMAGARFHHQYAKAVTFSSDSHALLLKLSGLATPNGYLDGWFCVYDILSGKTSLDLAVLNRGARHQR